jgi:hypothetical protein
MNDLTIDELKQLLIFYKQKASDLEYEILKGQVIMNRIPAPEVTSTIKNKKSE